MLGAESRKPGRGANTKTMFHPKTIACMVQLQLVLVYARRGIVPSAASPRTHLTRHVRWTGSSADSEALAISLRGGGSDAPPKVPRRRSKTKRRRRCRTDQPPKRIAPGSNSDGSTLPVRVHSILIPRQTSFLAPLRFLSLLLMNVSFSSCLKTSGKPLEDTVRRVLDMPAPEVDEFASKVTPLHVYVAKKILSSSSSLSEFNEMLPPGHLPSPSSLLGMFLSMLLYVGGTVLLPKWNVGFDVLLNYVQISSEDKQGMRHAGRVLQNWFDDNIGDDMGPISAPSESKRVSKPAVLVYEEVRGTSGQPLRQKMVVCPLHYSPGYDEQKNESQHDSGEQQRHHHLRRYYFELDKRRYYYDPAHDANAIADGGPNLQEAAPLELLSDINTGGLCSELQLNLARERYGPYSDISIPVPTLQSALYQRISSPLVSLQLIGRLLSLLEEESVGKALANLGRLGIQHFFDAERSIKSTMNLAEEVKGIDDAGDSCPLGESRFLAVRPVKGADSNGRATTKSEWVHVSSKDLLPGDVFLITPLFKAKTNRNGKRSGSVSHAIGSTTIPVDALLLEGMCVTEEAALTGETVPQAKMPLDANDTSPHLDMSGIHRTSCVFAGTELLHSSNCDEDDANTSRVLSTLPPLPSNILEAGTIPAVFLALRTGSYSSRGEIIQSLLKSKMNMGVSDRESELISIRLIGFLALFAVGACIFVLMESNSKDGQKDSVFKLIVQCTRIAIASVPSDLPASLSAVAYQCALVLREESDAVNSEPWALFESSKIDTVVFDKTGTLTSDTQALTSIEYPPRQQNMTTHSLKFLADIVLAGSHSLIAMNEDESNPNLVGDPVDLASLQFTEWIFNAHERSASYDKTGARKRSKKLWQIRSFPFDSIRKVSSALLLVQHGDGQFRLWTVVKGSASKLRDIVEMDGFTHEYDEKVKQLGNAGYRSIGLGALDVTDSAAGTLFPAGLPKPGDSTSVLEARIHEARVYARSLVRNDIETQRFGFVGFACFSAPMRHSSSMVVKELKSSLKVIMLTGDEPFASLAAAEEAGFLNGKKSRVCLLKTNEEGGMDWEINNKPCGYSLAVAKRVYRNVEHKGAALIISGDAIDTLLCGSATDGTSCYVREHLLPLVSLIASASPSDKCLFVKWLENNCKNKVLMVGDGVNDISAMKAASVSVAMLSGFGHESDKEGATRDMLETRRKERLERRYIGSNRERNPFSTKITRNEEAGIGDSLVASYARIKNSIRDNAGQLHNADEGSQHTGMFDVRISAIGDEIKRHTTLRKGGSSAAKILAEEDRLRESLQHKSNKESKRGDSFALEQIQTGESCLASSFTILRPSITGVESILRLGVTAAACAISNYRETALNCITSCYNMAALYRKGLRYGTRMWQVELASITSTYSASFAAASSPRPRLVAGVRPSSSPFRASEIIPILCQAFIHIVTLTCAFRAGQKLDEQFPTQPVNRGLTIKWGGRDPNSATTGSLLATLVGGSTSSSLQHNDTPAPSILRRIFSFQPNYVSNNVFIMSVFQNAVTIMVNYSGMPFSVRFLESRPLCLSESFPMLNSFIQLAPYPTKASKLIILRLLLFDVSMSYIAECISTYFLRHDIWKERNKLAKTDASASELTAADEEEKLLSEERQLNTWLVSMICLFISMLCMDIILS